MRSTTHSPDLKKRKLLSVLCHVSTLVCWLILPLIVAIFVICISEDEVTIENAKEVINFNISLFVYYTFLIISFSLVVGLVLLPVFPLLIIAHYILPIIAIIKCATQLNQPYRYPFIFRLV